MKGLIKVHPKYPASHHMVETMLVNLRHVVVIGETRDGSGYVETTTNWIITCESYEELKEMFVECSM